MSNEQQHTMQVPVQFPSEFGKLRWGSLPAHFQAYLASACHACFSDLRPKLITYHESVTTFVVHRYKQCQTELIIARPGAPAWPGEHRHPKVNSVEVALFKCDNFTRNGSIVSEPDFVINDLACVHLNKEDWHGTPFMPEGSSLISVQLWDDGTEPTSVGYDWEGLPTSPGHGKLIEAAHGG